jgi:glycosyltransferase involved in cell wall biosynthesis
LSSSCTASSGKNKMNYAILGSTADHGTQSISNAFISAMVPESVMLMSRGFKRSGWRSLLEGIRFIRKAEKTGLTVLCLFNAPVLLAALAPRKKGSKRIGILDWTEAYPSGKGGWKIWIYNRLYVWVFKRLDVVASPARGFREYYERYGVKIRECYYPLPEMLEPGCVRSNSTGHVRLLYIGADYRRKGGDVLLEMWQKERPPSAELTFVCPKPPVTAMDGVRFLTDIKAGSDEHKKLFAEHDLLILPTKQEPFGYVLLEGICNGLAVVTTRMAGGADLVRAAGCCVEGSPEAAVRKAFEIASSPDMLLSTAQSTKSFTSTYSQIFVQGIESLFKST